MNNVHCPMIHGGLNINLKHRKDQVFVNNCCLRNDLVKTTEKSVWQTPSLFKLRELNNSGTWDSGCRNCKAQEDNSMRSLRTGTLEMFGEKTDLSGPQRLDLLFDIGCNLACRTCGPSASTYWQKHLEENNVTKHFDISATSRADEMIAILKELDLSNLRLVVFCGGETLLGQQYWKVAKTIADLVPNAHEQITLSFQTNGTQPINERNFEIIEKFQLVKINISLDGVGERFEYLRWPASWAQVADNIQTMRDTAPVNVMFVVEETISIFNLFYQHELDHWTKANFSHNRLGDVTNHTKHLAFGTFALNGLSEKYVDSLPNNLKGLVPRTWSENPQIIQPMIQTIKQFDQLRNEDWTKTFPEVADFYSKFLTSGM